MYPGFAKLCHSLANCAKSCAHSHEDEGAPGGRLEYSEPYYGCFVRDPDGHKVEAAFWDEQLEQELS